MKLVLQRLVLKIVKIEKETRKVQLKIPFDKLKTNARVKD